MDNKTFIDTLSHHCGMPRKEAVRMADALGKIIGDVCLDGDVAVIPGFGTFETKKKMERVMAVPSSGGRRMLIPPKIVAAFRPSAVLKQRLNDTATDDSPAL